MAGELLTPEMPSAEEAIKSLYHLDKLDKLSEKLKEILLEKITKATQSGVKTGQAKRALKTKFENAQIKLKKLYEEREKLTKEISKAQRVINRNEDIIMGSKPIIYSLSLGLCAKEILHNEESASMVGITSAGIFLRSEKGKIIFLTSSPWRGPLTINLSDGIKNNRLQAGIEVRLAYPRIFFPDFLQGKAVPLPA